MIKNFASVLYQNKNFLMFFTVTIYILALYSVMSSNVILFSLLLLIFFVFTFYKGYFKLKLILIWVIVFFIGVINTSCRIKVSDELYEIAPINAVITGQVLSIPQYRGSNKQNFFFKVNRIEGVDFVQEFKNEKVLVSIYKPEKLRIYDYYKIKGRLTVPYKAGNPSQFDYRKYLQNYGVHTIFYGAKSNFIEKSSGKITPKQKCIQRVNDLRESIIKTHSKFLGTPNLEVLGGIVFGDDAISPPENVKQSFINSGLLHILAASGMNVAFIFSFFFFILSCFKVKYKVNISFGILMVLIYTLMTGLGASIVRATFMLVFVLIGKLIDRDAHNIALLAFVAFLMLLYNPMYINDVGFQLSFIVTFGLLLVTPLIVKYKSKCLNWIIGTICIPVIAQLWVIPIQIFYFNNISLYSVFANIMSVPILSVISFGGFVSSLVSLITPEIVCRCFDYLLNPLITLLLNISDFWGHLPNSLIHTTHPSILQILLYYCLLLSCVALLNKDIREKYIKFIKYLILFLLIVLLSCGIKLPNKNLEITAFDVGHADSFLIKTPENKYLMIDTANSGYNGSKSQFKMYISKFLIDRGIKEFDTVILTHFDNDHSGGAFDLLESVKVNKLYVNSLDDKSRTAKNIYNKAQQTGAEIVLAENNQVVYDNKNLLIKNYIAPKEENLSDNENSIWTLVKYNDFSMLFTGDAGYKSFKYIKEYVPLNISVLKLGHHGASNGLNKSMFKYLNPDVSLISVGGNRYKHPTKKILKILDGRKVVRTDLNNSILIIVNPREYKVYEYNMKKKKYVKVKFK